MVLNTMKIDSLEACFRIPEDLIFVACRQGIEFIKVAQESIAFTDIERLIMYSDHFDLSFIKLEDFRKQNSEMCPKLPIGG
ncbi:hypothetical protein DB891_10000 [Flavobacterium laiguense]|uniref:Uncharacterized protein n=2 Tax=Flavobacterium laiguense TaxID=2169409 RepID=A0A2U1JVK7_9FLAO|nr:hypothetical protein DB891_10000 [Flavobacterium laiguense]